MAVPPAATALTWNSSGGRSPFVIFGVGIGIGIGIDTRAVALDTDTDTDPDSRLSRAVSP
jgi:hypothetical protein